MKENKLINKKIINYFNLYWLRPENVPWDLHVCKIFQENFKINKLSRSLEIGSGHGYNTLLNLNGELNKQFDFFFNSKPNFFFKNNDIYDFKIFYKNKENLVTKPAENRFELVLDLKKNLINNSKLLNISKKYKVFDCNNDMSKFGRFDFIYTSIIYWLNNPYKSIINIKKLLNPNGYFLFTIPNQNFLKYCKSYSLKGKLWRLINRGRKKTLKLIVEENLFENWLKKNQLDIVTKNYFLSKKTLQIWDLGLRPISPFLIKMANSLDFNTRSIIKKEWCNNLMPIVKELSYEEIFYGKKKGGYCMYLVKLK